MLPSLRPAWTPAPSTGVASHEEAEPTKRPGGGLEARAGGAWPGHPRDTKSPSPERAIFLI